MRGAMMPHTAQTAHTATAAADPVHMSQVLSRVMPTATMRRAHAT
jgi:hypothetical protein